jgi:Polysaccharide pyruvyl transferase
MNDVKPLIFFHVHTQYENLGDMVINRNLLFLLREHGEVIVNDKDTPDYFLNDLGVTKSELFSNSYQGRFFLQLLFTAIKVGRKRQIYLFTPPGHKLSRSGDSKFKPLALSLVTVILTIFGVRVCEVGVSIGSFSWAKKLGERIKSGFMHFYGVRDRLSREIGGNYGIKNLSLVTDLSLAYPLILPHNKQYFVKELSDYVDENLKGLGEYLVISFRVDTTDPKTRNYAEKLTNYIIEVTKRLKLPIVLCYQVTRDRDYMFELSEKLSALGHTVKLLDKQLDLATAEIVYSRSSYVLSNRLHVLLFAALVDAFPVAIINPADNKKISALFSDAGISELILDVEFNEADKIDLSLNLLSSTRKEILDKLAALRRRGAEVLSSVFNEIFQK